MRILTCASYYATGSSAVTDFFSEYEDVTSLGKYEFRLVQDPDGISDLEYHLIEDNHRHNTSDAIKRYKKFVDKFKSFGYGGGYKIFGDQLEKLTDEYISEITELKVKSWWHRDRIDKGELFCFIDRAYSWIRRLFSGGLKTEKKYSLLARTEWGYFSAISQEDFLKFTRKYLNDLLSCVNKENAPFLMVDQLLPPTNTDRYLRYFDDIRLIVVERDPRDVYLSEKVRYQWGVIPTENVEEYVEWFKITRRYSHPEQEDTSRVLRLRFEDMIYHYDETAARLEAFVGLSPEQHIRPKTAFDPARSIHNTNLKDQMPEFEKDIAYIEKELKDYLYDFE